MQGTNTCKYSTPFLRFITNESLRLALYITNQCRHTFESLEDTFYIYKHYDSVSKISKRGGGSVGNMVRLR